MKIIAAALVLLCSSVVSAQEAETHNGIHLNAEVGVGTLNFTLPTESASAAALQYSLALGGALSRHFVLSATWWGTTGYFSDGTLTVSALAPELTCYFSSNLFISAAFGLSFLTLTPAIGLPVGPVVGTIGRLSFGKEWWVSPRWAMGIAVRAAVGVTYNGDGVPLVTTDVASAFTVSFK